jgi:hypothetical protein
MLAPEGPGGRWEGDRIYPGAEDNKMTAARPLGVSRHGLYRVLER